MTSTSKRYCSVPQCHSYKSKDVSLYYFPHSFPKLCKQWKHVLKIGKVISKYMNVCSKHFSDDDFVEDNDKKRKYKRLKPGSVPSKNLPIGSIEHKRKKQRKTGIWRYQIQANNIQLNQQEDEAAMDIDNDNLTETESLIETPPKPKEFCDRGTQTDPFKLTDILNTDAKLKTFTSVESCTLETMVKCTENVASYNNGICLSLKMKIVLLLVKLKLNIPFTSVAILFSLSESTATRYFYSTISLLATAIKPAIYWPRKEEILANMPKCFKSFKSTRVVLDCTEIAVQKCKCLKCRLLSYSHYKGTNTLKFLVGVTPSGLISYMSPAYGGRTSDKAIFNEENLIQQMDPLDAIMVDKGFLIENECNDHLVTLIRPPFLRKQSQFSQSDANKTAEIARARVHVERTIQRIKNYKILNDQIEWYMLPYIDQIMTVCAALVNWSAPILAGDKFDNIE